MMGRKRVVVTGGSGLIGSILRRGLREYGYEIENFDKLRGPVVDLLRYKYFGTSESRIGRAIARRSSKFLGRGERGLIKFKLLRPSGDDILDIRERLAKRFRGSFAVVHLAALPHPDFPGAIDADFDRINFDGAVNVFEAAKDAGVAKFIFASSGQVYGINRPVRIDQFPILETNYTPTKEDGQHKYGLLKLQFEKYIENAVHGSSLQARAMRLEMPGIRSSWAGNFFVSTSVENLVKGFDCALRSDEGDQADVFNLADSTVPDYVVDIQKYLRETWPEVPNYTRGNQCLLSIDKSQRIIGFEPTEGGHYLDPRLIW